MPKTIKSNTASAIQSASTSAGTMTRNASAPGAKSKTTTGNGARKDQAKSIQPISERFPAQEEQEITLKYFSPDARDVKVAGNFNGWRPERTPLKNTGAGEWFVHLALRSGQYEYRFVVDGRWVEDPRATQRGANPYGGFNSILTVPLAVRTSLL